MMPQLRFPEFTDEWQVKKLGDLISSLDAGVSANSGDRRATHGEYAILKTSCVTKGVFDPSENKVVTSGSEIKRLKEPVRRNTIIISRMNTPQLVGANAFVADGFSNIYLPDRLWAAKIKKDASPRWVASVVGSRKYRIKLSELATGTSNSMKNITKSDVLNLEVIAPTTDEQEKIAGFLGVVDDQVAATQQKVELLKKYKKGVMQKIFTQQIRFKDENGNSYPAWQQKKLGEVGEIVGGGTPDTTNNRYWGGDICWLTPTEVKGRYIDSSKRTITGQGLKNSSAKLLPVGTVIFTSRATVGDVAIAQVPLTTNQGFQSIIVNDRNDNRFIYYWIAHNKKEFLRKASGSTFPEISKNEMSKVIIALPSKNEQQKIADFLTTLDDKIKLEEAKLAKSKEFKKSLLQRMFA